MSSGWYGYVAEYVDYEDVIHKAFASDIRRRELASLWKGSLLPLCRVTKYYDEAGYYRQV